MSGAVDVIGRNIGPIAYGILSSTPYGWIVAIGMALLNEYNYDETKRRAQAARDAYNRSLQDRIVMVPASQVRRSRIYGRARNVDGIIYRESHGSDLRFLTMVVALCGHEVDGIEDVYLDDVKVTLDGDGHVMTAPWLGASPISALTKVTTDASGNATVDGIGPVIPDSVTGIYIGNSADESITLNSTCVGSTISLTGGPVSLEITVTYQYTVGVPFMRVRKFLGAPDQSLVAPLSELLPGSITETDRFSGIACLLVTMEFNQDAFPTGIPSISAVVRGAKVLDPRTGVTAWTENPALIARDWALYQNGGACTTDEIVEGDFIAAANVCDTSTTWTLADASTLVTPLYECGLVAPLDASPQDTLSQITDSMAGNWSWAGGKLRMVAGSYRAPVVIITEDWVHDGDSIDILPQLARSDLFNIGRPFIADRDHAYTETALPEIRSAAYIEADGEELPRETRYPSITRAVHGQHVTGIRMRQLRDGMTVKLPCKMHALSLEVFDTVAVTLPRFGWFAKVFEILSWSFSLTGGVVLQMREHSAPTFAPDATFDVIDADPNTTLLLPTFVPAVTGLTAESGTDQLLLQADGTVLSRVKVSWNPIDNISVVQSGRVEVRWGAFGTDEATWQTEVAAGSATQVFIIGAQDGQPIVIKARAANTLVRGVWCTQITHLVVGKTEPPVNVSGLTATAVQMGVRLDWDANTEVDYSNTELRIGGSVWADATLPPLFKGKANTYTWLRPSAGAYTIRAKHVDTTGNASTGTAAITVFVGANPIDGALAAAEAAQDAADAAAAAAAIASAAAAAAQADADAANSAISDIGADNVLTAGEKPILIQDYAVILAEQTGIDAQATAYGITTEKATYDGAITSLTGYLATLTAPVAWDNLTGITTVVGSTLRANFEAVYTSRQELLNGVTTRAKAIADDAQTSADSAAAAAATAQAAAVAAQATADAASADAANALSDLADIASDNVLTPGEKPTVIQDYTVILAEQSGIDTQATAYGISTEKTAYDTAVTALTTHLGTLTSPVAWNVLTGMTTIVGTTLRTKFGDAYAARQALLNKIAEIAGTKALWSGVSGVSVTTSQIAPGATTEIYTESPSGGVTITGMSHVPDGFNAFWNTQVVSITFTPADDGNAQVFIDAFGTYVNGDSFPAYGRWSIQDAGGTFAAGNRRSQSVAASATALFPVSSTRSFSVVGGTTYEFGLYAAKLNAGDTFTIDNIQMRIEVVKR